MTIRDNKCNEWNNVFTYNKLNKWNSVFKDDHSINVVVKEDLDAAHGLTEWPVAYNICKKCNKWNIVSKYNKCNK